MTSPLSLEAVAQMVATLREKAPIAGWWMVADNAADMLTTIAAENATLRASEAAALERIAALTEALTETAAILQAAVVTGKVRGGDSYRIGGVYLQTVSDALDAADAAITTDKEPTT